jgi:hypothetical protein
MSSTFTSPIRIFMRNNPTNDGTIAPDNTGAAMVSKQTAVVAATAATVVIPAGSIINHISVFLNVVGAASRAISVTSNGTTTAIGSVVTTALGKANASYTASAAVANLLANVGAYDVTITLASEAASAGVFNVEYTARNADGTITAYGAGLSNS